MDDRQTRSSDAWTFVRFSTPARGLALAAFAAFGVAGCTPAIEDEVVDEAFVQQSEQIAARLQNELKAELLTALKKAKPTGAIDVCQSAAPAIAQNLSAESGLMVSRIAQRNRNPSGIVDVSIDALYTQLERQPIVDGAPNAVHGVIDGRATFLQAIPMKEQPCGVCHGTNISPEVSEAIASSYPNDRATGFRPGELRGAILVQASQKPNKAR